MLVIEFCVSMVGGLVALNLLYQDGRTSFAKSVIKPLGNVSMKIGDWHYHHVISDNHSLGAL